MYKWYALKVVSGCEKTVKEQILDKALGKKETSNLFEEIVIPSIEVTETKGGKKKSTDKKLMPGYIFIKMEMRDEARHLIRSIPKTINFLGSGTTPKEISQVEMNRIFAQEVSENQKASLAKTFAVGEKVNVSDGPFASLAGTIEKIDLEKETLRLSVSLFGKSTPVELKFAQVEKRQDN